LASAEEVKKSGAGTLRLSTQNNFSAAITVSEGVLELATDWTLGNVGTGTPIVPGLVTVESGATLRAVNGLANQLNGLTLNGGTVAAVGGGNADWGNFHLTGNVTATGTSNLNADVALRAANVDFFVDSGSTLNVGGVMHNGAYYGIYSGAAANVSKTGSGTLTLAGLNTYTGNTSVEDGILAVSATGGLRFRPTTNTVTNSVSAGSSSATLSFTGTVNIDLSAADATIGNSWPLINLASFTGTQTLTPTAVTSSLGAFSEVSPGTWELPVTGAKWVFTEVDGNLAYVNAASPYQTWGTPYGLTAGSEGGDLDNDGLTNFQEFAFGLIPNSGSSVNPITSQLDKTTGKFTYQRLTASGLTYTVWYSTDLATWLQDSGAGQSITGTSGANDTVEVTLTGTLLSNPKLFIRVRAQ
jgi:autotransporter-associated beta strand protein